MNWVYATDNVIDLKNNIVDQISYLADKQHLLARGRSLQDSRSIKDYKVKPGSTIILNMRLRGGATTSKSTEGGSGSKSNHNPDLHQQHRSEGTSYKNILQGGKASPTIPKQVGSEPSPYIVEQMQQTPELIIHTAEAEKVCCSYEKLAIICRFNRFWPKPLDLFHWIFTKWSMDCEIHLCSKGFFIVKFQSSEVRDLVIQEGPWFWGSSGLFITPWFPEFDANTFVVSKMPVWVRLHNLPIHFWDQKIFVSIGNAIGRYIKMDTQRIDDFFFYFCMHMCGSRSQ